MYIVLCLHNPDFKLIIFWVSLEIILISSWSNHIAYIEYIWYNVKVSLKVSISSAYFLKS